MGRPGLWGEVILSIRSEDVLRMGSPDLCLATVWSMGV